ncbi:Cell division control protein 7 [Coemansia sp. Benny D115]|nr:Cell division control protein 7 [Coemansia sp. Benny D115]
MFSPIGIPIVFPSAKRQRTLNRPAFVVPKGVLLTISGGVSEDSNETEIDSKANIEDEGQYDYEDEGEYLTDEQEYYDDSEGDVSDDIGDDLDNVAEAANKNIANECATVRDVNEYILDGEQRDAVAQDQLTTEIADMVCGAEEKDLAINISDHSSLHSPKTFNASQTGTQYQKVYSNQEDPNDGEANNNSNSQDQSQSQIRGDGDGDGGGYSYDYDGKDGMHSGQYENGDDKEYRGSENNQEDKGDSDDDRDAGEDGGNGEEDNDNEDGDDDEDILDGDTENTQEEIEELEKLIPGLAEQYRLLGKIGEGTFSTVYKAIDLQHDQYDNSSWTMIFNSDPDITEPCESTFGKGTSTFDQIINSRRQGVQSQNKRARIVAIKKIYVTSSPTRIANEISILNDLRGSRYIAPLVTAMRREDQVVIVLPYFPNDDFRRFYLDMPIEEMRWYFASLLSALAYTHSKGIMHRDIKPSNFLYDVRRRHGVLVDFGLAERENDQEAERYRSRYALQMDSNTAMRMFRSVDQKGRPGIPRRDTRPGLRANRAGTRGFRAPEVLLKIAKQSVAIDVWSVGVILLCFLTRRFPFFQSTDDTEALLEIAVLYGRLEMERAAVSMGRTFLTNIPTVKDRGIRFESLAKAYNTEGYADLPPEVFDLLRRLLALNPSTRITAEQALRHPFVANRK